jgi:hypothetical protein
MSVDRSVSLYYMQYLAKLSIRCTAWGSADLGRSGP